MPKNKKGKLAVDKKSLHSQPFGAEKPICGSVYCSLLRRHSAAAVVSSEGHKGSCSRSRGRFFIRKGKNIMNSSNCENNYKEELINEVCSRLTSEEKP